MTEVAFRPAVPADAATIAAYHHRCWLVAFADLVDPGAVARLDPEGKLPRWREWLEAGSGFQTVVAELDGRPIGHTTVHGATLVHLFIDPDHWGLGLGRRLLAVGEGLIAAAGHRDAELQTIVGNEPALALYRSAGWTVTDRIERQEYGGLTYDEHVLVKRLPEPSPG